MPHLVSRVIRCFLFLVPIAFICTESVVGQGGVCPISSAPLDASEWPVQAKCLLRKVKMNRELEPALINLPAPLDSLIGTTNVIAKAALKQYLIDRGIDQGRLGGPINNNIAKARYFIIHDTSSPNFVREEFPAIDVINGPQWNHGRLSALISGQRTHVWINRVGQSATSRDYAQKTLKTGVKLESKFPALRGLLLHNELIQPRRCNPNLTTCCRPDANGNLQCNDAIAPQPGFSVEQLDRLALLYVAASTRRGRWLIPAFHGVIDDEFGNRAHDDPQNFDLGLWAARLQLLLADLRGMSRNSFETRFAHRRSSLITPFEEAVTMAENVMSDTYHNKLGRYMEESCEPEQITNYPLWENYPLNRCHYRVDNQDGTSRKSTVLMINPSLKVLIRWVAATCLEIKGQATKNFIKKLIARIRGQSGSQFVVAGIVYEDQNVPQVFELYCFRHGVTVGLNGLDTGHKRRQVTPEELELALSPDATIKWSGDYARIQGTTREEYKSNEVFLGRTPQDVGESKPGKRKLSWIAVVRDEYQKAWKSAHDPALPEGPNKYRNELMIAWARQNIP